ncbi:hypothetical protein MP228_003588 [Amoeboaphelidium protococcarum]|nr:hypothetical protein MP228_003588 [Amoeboaphelidium protococcarum]
MALGNLNTEQLKQEIRYELKRIRYPITLDDFIWKTIVLQDVNGPCPLISIVNYLVITDRFEFKDEQLKRGVSNLELYEVIIQRMYSDQSADNVVDASIMFSAETLSQGLHVNPDLYNVSCFEPTNEIKFFQSLGVKLVHGWLIPKCGGLDQKSSLFYDEATMMIVQGQDAEEKLQKHYGFSQQVEDGKQDTLQALTDEQIESCESQVKLAHTVQIALDASRSQITIEGISELLQSLQPFEPAVLFRNNHFSIIVKVPIPGQNEECRLINLVTDAGYRESDIVWEAIMTEDGDTQYLDHRLIPINTFKSIQSLSEEEQDRIIALELAQREQDQYQAQQERRARQNQQSQSATSSYKRDKCSVM